MKYYLLQILILCLRFVRSKDELSSEGVPIFECFEFVICITNYCSISVRVVTYYSQSPQVKEKRSMKVVNFFLIELY